MEERNREAGFEMFRYLGLGNGGPYREIRYLYRPRRYSEPVEMSYGGYPFLSDVWLLKDYLEEC